MGTNHFASPDALRAYAAAQRAGSGVNADAPEPGPREEAESRMGVQPIRELTEQRAHLVRKVHKALALYGPAQTWKARRDSLLSLLRNEVRQAKREKGEKVTETEVSDLAAANPRFTSFIDEHEMAMALHEIDKDDLQAITDTILRDNGIVKFVIAERSSP